MATTTETVLLQVDVQANAARLKEITVELTKAKNSLDLLNGTFKAGGLSVDEYAEAQNRLKATVSNLTTEQGVLLRANAAQVASNKAAEGSIDQLAAQSKLLTAAFNKLSEAERNTASGRTLQDSLKETNDKLIAAGKSVSDGRRSVGLYKEAILDAAKSSGLFGDLTDRVTGLQNKFTLAQDLAKKALGNTAAASNVLKVSLLAIPLFAIIAAFSALYSFLTSTQEGMDYLARKTAGLGAVLSVVTNAVNVFGSKLFAAADNPKKALTDLVEFLENNVANRFKAFGVLLDAIRNRDLTKLGDGVIQLTTGITDGTAKAKALAASLNEVAKSGEAIEAETQRIGNVERALNLERDRSRAKIEALKKLADDTTKSAAARADAARQAGEIESRLLTQQLALQDAKIANLKAEQTLKKATSDADQDALNELLQGRANLEQESLKIQNNLQNKVNAINEAARAKEDARMAAQIDREIAEADARIERADKFRDSEDKGRAVQKAKEDAARAEKLTADKAAYDAELAQLERFLGQMSTKAAQDQAAGLLNKAGYDQAIELRDSISFATRLMLARKFNKDTTKIEEDQAKADLARQTQLTIRKKRLKEAEMDTQQAAVQAGLAGSDALISALGEETEAGQAALALKKVLTLAEIGLNLQKQLALNATAAAELAASIPPPAGITAGAAYLAASNALAIASAAAGAATVLAFNTGGMVPGQGNTDSVPAILTPGEVVMNKQASQTFAPLLSALNVMSGGAAFGPTAGRGSGDGGMVARSIVGGLIDYQQLAAAIAQQPISVDVKTISAQQGRMVRARNLTTLK